MRLRRCTIDTSCIIALNHVHLVPMLTMLFSRVLGPKAVIERCDDYDRGAVGLLLTERNREGVGDWGEVETVRQAAQLADAMLSTTRSPPCPTFGSRYPSMQ